MCDTQINLQKPQNKTFPQEPPAFQADDIKIYDLGPGSGPGFGVSNVEHVQSEQCLDHLEQINVRTTGLIEEPSSLKPGEHPPEILTYEIRGDTAEFHISAQNTSLFIRPETWAPGWQATVNGQQVEVLRVDCAFQGIWLKPGEHHVIFQYLPKGYLIGRWVSLGSFLSTSAILIWFAISRNKSG